MDVNERKIDIVFFTNSIHVGFGGMETHQNIFIEHYTLSSSRYAVKYIAVKKDKYYIYYNGKSIFEADSINVFCQWLSNSLSQNAIFMFNNLSWIEDTENLRNYFPKIKFVIRSGGNDIFRAPIYTDEVLLELRQRSIVDIINAYINCLIVNSDYSYFRNIDLGINPRIMKKVRGGVNKKESIINIANRKHERELFDEKYGTYGKKIIVVACRLVPFKGVIEMLEEIRKIQHIENWFLVIIGDGELSSYIENYLSESFEKGRYVMLGAMSNAHTMKYISLCDLLINTSLYYLRNSGSGHYIHTETMGRSMIEALMNNVPILATNVGGTSEIFEENKSVGFLINDISEINKVLIDYFNGRDIEVVLDKDYSWENVFSQYNEIFDYLLNFKEKKVYVLDIDGTILNPEVDLNELEEILLKNKNDSIYIFNTARELDERTLEQCSKWRFDYIIVQNGLKIYTKDRKEIMWNDLAQEFCEEEELQSLNIQLKKAITEQAKVTHPNVISIRLNELTDVEELTCVLSKYLNNKYKLLKSKRFIKIAHMYFNKKSALDYILKDFAYSSIIAAGNSINDVDFVTSADISFLSDEFCYLQHERIGDGIQYFHKSEVGPALLRRIFI